MLVVTRAGRLREWSQGELLLYLSRTSLNCLTPLVNFSCLLSADDLILLSESETGLQTCLHTLHCYLKKWQMKGEINIKKTKIIVFNESGKGIRSELRLGN